MFKYPDFGHIMSTLLRFRNVIPFSKVILHFKEFVIKLTITNYMCTR